MTCPVCGTVAVPGARFCHSCGTALPAAANTPAAERRTVTVLFGDLSDFTAWAEDLDPERVGAVTDRVLAALAGAVKTFGGHVDKLTGDGIMAVFGAPVAHEDDAERAVRAALSMQRAVRRVLDDERGGGAPLGLRVGLNTGPVVAGFQAALEYTVIGDTVNTAARLADAAAIGTIYAGGLTAAGTRHVASWRRLSPLRLKGKRAPVEAYELLGLLDAPGTRSGMGDEAPFVGREPELALIASRLAEAVDRGEPRVVLLTAEAGIGKTRFAGEVQRYASAQGVRVLSVHCAAYGERRRLGPLADLVRSVIGLPTSSGPGAVAEGSATNSVTPAAVQERLRRLVTRLQPLTTTGPRPSVDLLLALLGFTELSGSGEGPVNGRDDLLPDELPATVASLLSGLAREAPLLVIVDDVHDATPESVDALGAMLGQLDGPVLTLLVGRPEVARGSGLTRLADAEIQALPPLRGAETTRLLSAYLGSGRLSQADTDRLLATAQGNPFYLAELVTLLMERGALTSVGADAPAQWRLATGSLGGRLLSRDLAAVLAARLDALPAEARSVLRDASVIGDTVPAGALAALRERRANRSGRPSAVLAVELERAVDELLQRRMLRRVRGGYAFATPLMREAAYAGISKADLAERHAYLAAWAADIPPTPTTGFTQASLDGFVAEQVERASTLADAIGLRADDPARAVAPLGVTALGRAARRALAGGEPTLAVEYSRRAAKLAGEELPPIDRLVTARALLQLSRPTDALAEAEKIEANAPDDPASRAGALLIAGRAHRLLGEPERAGASWQEALEVATAADLPAERAEAFRRLGMHDFLGGRLAEAGSRFAAAYQVAAAAEDERSQAWSLQNLAWVATTRGDFAGADAALGRAARLFATQRDQYGRAWLRGTTAFARLLAGRLTDAQRLARIFLPFGERHGELWAVGTLRAVDAFAAAELGDLAEADRDARRAYRDFALAADDWGRGLALVVRGVIARGVGEPDHALDLLADALGYGDKTGHPLLIGMARTIRGFVRLDQGEPDRAEADARTVLETVAPHNVLPPAQVAPRTLLGLARLSQGDVAGAQRLLASVAAETTGASLLFPRRQVAAHYAQALLAEGANDEALRWAQTAVDTAGEDIRSEVVAHRVLAEALLATGVPAQARAAAEVAARLAYSTQQRSERPAVHDLLARLGVAGLTS